MTLLHLECTILRYVCVCVFKNTAKRQNTTTALSTGHYVSWPSQGWVDCTNIWNAGSRKSSFHDRLATAIKGWPPSPALPCLANVYKRGSPEKWHFSEAWLMGSKNLRLRINSCPFTPPLSSDAGAINLLFP